MIKTLYLLKSILTRSERKRAILVFLMMLGLASFETIGVASIMPFIAVASNPELVHTNAVLSFVYDLVGAESVERFVFLLGLVVFFLLVTALAFKALTQWAMISFTQMRIHALGCRVLERYLGQPYSWFLSKHSSRMSTTILAEVNKVVAQTMFPFMQVVAHSLIALFLFTFLLFLEPQLTLVMALVIGFCYVTLYLVVRHPLRRIGTRRLTANRERFRVTNEALGGVKDVKIAGLEKAMLERFHDPSRRMARAEAHSQLISQLPGHAMQALIFGGAVLVILFMMTVHESFVQALPVIGTFAFAGYRLMPSLQTVYRQQATVRGNVPALESLCEDLQRLDPLNPRDADGRKVEPMEFGDRLCLKDVWYTYPGASEAALRSLSLEVPAGATVGLVGESGSGKTTTVDVILGLLEAEAGEISVDGKVITDENLRRWQRAIGYVPQHIYLADDTIAGNIAFGLRQDEVDHEAVKRAAKAAKLHQFIESELPDGYETQVGERGVRLSGGQRQRIGIARALYHDPAVLIMDEATSALDNLTESAVMEAVQSLSGEKTIIIIAHRLSTVKSSDLIYYLSKGQVQAAGTFDQLVHESEGFRAMAQKT